LWIADLGLGISKATFDSAIRYLRRCVTRFAVGIFATL